MELSSQRIKIFTSRPLQERSTKQTILPKIFQIFGPLGLNRFFVVRAKVILRRIWLLRLIVSPIPVQIVESRKGTVKLCCFEKISWARMVKILVRYWRRIRSMFAINKWWRYCRYRVGNDDT